MLNFNRIIHAGVAAKLNQAPEDGLPEIVLAGRSNAGKSSLINALANHGNLAKVSSTPGKTRLVVYFNIDEKVYLTDLPGYGYAKLGRDAKERFNNLANSYFEADRPIALALLLVDIRHDPSAQDVQMFEYLKTKGIKTTIILAKADKLSRSQGLLRKRYMQEYFNYPEDVEFLVVSSSKKTGLDLLKAHLSDLFG